MAVSAHPHGNEQVHRSKNIFYQLFLLTFSATLWMKWAAFSRLVWELDHHKRSSLYGKLVEPKYLAGRNSLLLPKLHREQEFSLVVLITLPTRRGSSFGVRDIHKFGVCTLGTATALNLESITTVIGRRNSHRV